MSKPLNEMQRPLDGIKVLDFTHGVAGPYCSMVLGDLGCDVIKIEKPRRGDPTRYMNVSQTFQADIPRVGGDYFLAINRNKRGVTIELKTEEGRDICKRLAGWADIALQSFRPGVMARLGLDYPALKAVNPGLIYGNLSAYGLGGPLAGRAGMDVAVQARSGVMKLTGRVGDNEPLRPGVSLADFGGGIFLATAIITALYTRERTGVGQEINISLLDATMSLLSNYTVACYDGKARLEPMGSGHPQLVPYQAFPTSDGHVVVGAGTNKLYREFCVAIGATDLVDDARFTTNQDRVARRHDLIPLISTIMARKSTKEWMRVLEDADVPCAPVNDMYDAVREPQLVANDMIQAVEHPVIGLLHVMGSAFKFSDMKSDVRRSPPMLGQHTDEVLRDLLGYKQEQVKMLRSAGVI